ncbi:MAG: ribosome maturation factor RimP [Bryobacter sp.]|nr:ribosome maturation factor RimP [Bryobacter sp.]
MKGLVLEKIRDAAERISAQAAVELVDVQFLGAGSRRVLKLLIDKPAGVTHADCEAVSRSLGELLDAEDIIPGEGYTLEVSSPGVDRPLVKPADFARFLGQKIRIQLREPREKRKRFDGLLESFDGSRLTLALDKGERLEAALSDIDKANLKYDWR